MRPGFAHRFAAAALLAAACSRPGPLDFSGPTADWPEYAGDKGGLHYSVLTQVTRANVGRLELAWSHAAAISARATPRTRRRRSRSRRWS